LPFDDIRNATQGHCFQAQRERPQTFFARKKAAALLVKLVAG
jgi:hypothetical protein